MGRVGNEGRQKGGESRKRGITIKEEEGCKRGVGGGVKGDMG